MRIKEKTIFAIHKVQSLFTHELTCEQYFKLFMTSFAAFFSMCILLVIFIDPYVRYHRAFALRQVYQNSSAMIPGLFRHEKFDSVLIGSSMAQNFDISEINRILETRCIKATSAGLPSETLSVYIEKAIEHKGSNLKRMFICLDFWAFSKDNFRLHDNYKYLYSDTLFAPEYFFSPDTFDAVFNAILTNIAYPVDATARHEADRNKMFANKPRVKYGKKIFFRSLKRDIDNIPVPGANVCQNLQTHLLDHIRRNPQIQFDIFLPPYSVYYWCLLSHKKTLEQNLYFRTYLAEELKKLPNVRLHDLQTETSVTENFENYKDITHYSRSINTWILEAIRSGKYANANIAENNVSLHRTAAKHEKEFQNILKQAKK